MGRKKPTDENPQGGGGKSKKKQLAIDDDEYNIDTGLSEELNDKVSLTGKKKGKKGNQKSLQPDEEKEDVEEDGEIQDLVFSGKKKSKGKKNGTASVFSASQFGLLRDEDNDNNDDEETSDLLGDKNSEVEDEPVVSFTGKKKASKKPNKTSGSLFSAAAFDALDDDNEGEEIDKSEEGNDDYDMPVIEFTGKKKSSKGAKKVGSSVFTAATLHGLDDNEEVNGDEDEDDGAITFSGKKKSSKKAGNKFSSALLEEENDEEASATVKISDDIAEAEDDDGAAITFTGKKKSSKKKGKVNDDVAEQQTGVLEAKDKGEEVVETSKNKKKKKNKSGRTAQEEEDLDKILAELGEGLPTEKPSASTPQEESNQVHLEQVPPENASGEKEGEEEKEESAAAKKKKKKKEKEKEKKAAAVAAAAAASQGKEEIVEQAKAETKEPKKSDAKGKAADKKVPKHVREMQEALARRKELEERKAREEEEKRRKEEEERRRQEELERQAEEARRRKKEREKEKLLKKKQEGKLLTGKQKEEQRRLEAMRNQILANAGITIPAADKEGAPTKRPKYHTKKSKPAANHHANDAAPVKLEENVEATEKEQEQQDAEIEVEPVEMEKVAEEESINAEEKTEVRTEENGMEEDEDDEEWDAKSWDDVNLNVKGAFDDEEIDSEPKKKEVKNAAPASRNAAAKPAVAGQTPIPSQSVKSQDAAIKKPHPEVDDSGKNRTKDAAAKNKTPPSDATPKESEENLRSPICCIMGHVDTGKTKLLDCIRGTNVQEGEAGGITQQIGATYFPAENIRERTKELKADAKLKVPGLLVIDTPGHESFTNLRSRGSGLCDIAILVVDIMHGLEPQTIESLNLLRMRNTEFIVALNKMDRLYGWKVCRNAPIVKAMKQQSKDVQNEFNRRLTGVITQFKEQGLNTELYYKNREMGETFSIVPTSAISGEGIPDLLLLLVQWTQKTMVEKLTYSDEVQCTVLEVKVIEGHGTTIDVVLVNGVLHEGDQIVVCGFQGPIVTTIRALLTPHPMKELRVKGTYLHHKEIKAAQGIKISAQGLEHALAGTGLYVVGPDDNLEDIKEAAMEDVRSVMNRIEKRDEGVYVQASTLGSLEALLEFLKSPAVGIPVSGIGIGPVHKKDVMKASVMLEKKKEYATILAFDVKVSQETRELADDLGVKIFMADIIYHLFDQFKAYIDNLKEEKKKEAADEAVFPCVLKILPNCIFNKKDPIVLGVEVTDGIVKVGTPICVPDKDFIDIGRVASIENNYKAVDYAKKGQSVAIKLVNNSPEDQQKMYGRHFDHEDLLVSRISRTSIDVLKANYRDDLSMDEWRLVVKLKNIFKIQ
ncbi:eukaryotic translation initiation factor 5B isoform X2 [Ricinus communis]|uniref:eukaryotic translation initiation factor 5B isoform X2 n=1 Tax=Ricinus communis TaxID=3988 RepID=UPI00201AA20C|nr:eukaryotic translation initiation factor 5B isoform X2 [Ricinus communis]